jgi:hemerythrin superfamily protein
MPRQVPDGAWHARRTRMANVKRGKTIDVLDLLTSQHVELDQLFDQLERDAGDIAAVFQDLADKLAAHATAEEKVFYPHVMSDRTADLLRESVEEHLEIKRTLADMLVLGPRTDEFKAKLSVLKENVSHHAHEEEEDKLFPMLRKQLSADERAGLGNDVLALYETLLPQHPARNVRSETAKAAPLPNP